MKKEDEKDFIKASLATKEAEVTKLLGAIVLLLVSKKLVTAAELDSAKKEMEKKMVKKWKENSDFEAAKTMYELTKDFIIKE